MGEAKLYAPSFVAARFCFCGGEDRCGNKARRSPDICCKGRGIPSGGNNERARERPKEKDMRRKLWLPVLFVLCLALTVGMLVACDPGSSQDGTQTPGDTTTPGVNEPGDENAYTEGLVFEDIGGSYSVTGYEGTDAEVVIPETYEDLPVTVIAERAFADQSTVTSVTIPNSVTSIGDYAFYNCDSLTSVTIPNSVTSIGSHTFWYCDSLTSVTIGNGVTSIGLYAFSDCTSLASITIPDSVTSIGSSAFWNCTSLTSITIPASVTSIGLYAFNGCSKLIEVYDKSSLGITAGSSDHGAVASHAKHVYTEEGGSWLSDTEDGFRFFYDGETGYLVAYLGNEAKPILPDSFTAYDGTKVTSYQIYNHAFYGRNDLTSVTIPDSVTSIESYAFSDCKAEIIWGGTPTITEIGDYAFAYYDGTSITIPDSVTSIGWDAFNGCYKLIEVYNKSDLDITAGSSDHGEVASHAKHVYTEEGGSWLSNTEDGFCFFYDGETGYLVAYYGDETELTLPDSFTAYDETEVTSYQIYDYAFYERNDLTSVAIPDSVTSIESNAFSDCTSLTSVTIGNGVTSIGYRAFYNCDSLTSITIPDSVTSLGIYAFNGCTSLTSVTIPDSVTSIGSSAFSGCDNLQYNVYGNALYLGNDENPYVVLIEAKDKSITSVDINASTKVIYQSAFSGCTSLTSVTIGNGVTSIGENAFWNCDSLASVTIGNSVTSIGNYAFYNCTSLTSVTIGNSVTSIGNYAFQNCTSLTSVTFEGTMAEWNAVDKGSYWKRYSPFTEVKCSDGVVEV